MESISSPESAEMSGGKNIFLIVDGYIYLAPNVKGEKYIFFKNHNPMQKSRGTVLSAIY